MANSFFKFKKFIVYHDKCAMKVGTDGVLLGAWAEVVNTKKIIDIGTGSGLIALMLAQRSEAEIEAIDIDASACIQAEENIAASLFKDRIRVKHLSLQSLAEQSNDKYDLVVSNPPYFEASLLSPVHERNLARHNNTLSLDSLLRNGKKILSPEGRIALILPYDREEELNQRVADLGLFFSKKAYVRPMPKAGYKRLLAEISPQASICQENELTIEIARHQYTPAYIELTKKFYLKM